MADALETLRKAIASGTKVEPVSSDDGPETSLKEAKLLRVQLPDTQKPVLLDLSQETNFESELLDPKRVSLKIVYNTWITRDESIAVYIAAAEELAIANLKFTERTDLIAWLDGSSAESDYIVTTPAQQKEKARDVVDGAEGEAAVVSTRGGQLGIPDFKLGSVVKKALPEHLQKIYSQERTMTDHNTALRGNKRVDFASVSKDCHRLIMQEYKNKIAWSNPNSAKRAKPGIGIASAPGTVNYASNGGTGGGLVQQGKNKEPIILLSSSPSSLLNMANVKKFLELGIFEPVLRSSSTPNFLRITRESKLLGTTRFVVVDNVERFKPEYWDRVVAVFVTGQLWQFKPYKWTDPYTLFQHVRGFSLQYKGDPVPSTISQWHVQVEQIDRTHRFRDRELVEHIWEELEGTMVRRGWPIKRQ